MLCIDMIHYLFSIISISTISANFAYPGFRIYVICYFPIIVVGCFVGKSEICITSSVDFVRFDILFLEVLFSSIVR